MPTLADIFHAYGGKYRERFAARMSDDQLRAMRDIEACHSAAAGEALWRCPGCGKRHFTFLACGNRHCPSCGGTRAEQWQRKHKALLLPGVIYHLITFTLPEGLRRVVRSHPRELLEILMQTSASTLLDVAANKKWLGAMPGLTALLHTWTRQYEYHPHVHFIGTGGGIAPDGQWKEAHRKFLLPVHALSSVFRARFRDTLRQLHPQIYDGVRAARAGRKARLRTGHPAATGAAMIRPRFTRQSPPENLHPLAQGSQTMSTNGNIGLERLPCDAPAACKGRCCGLPPLTPCLRRRQITASDRARR